MAGFEFKKRQNNLTVEINGQKYEASFSPGDYNFIKKISSLAKLVTETLEESKKPSKKKGLFAAESELDELLSREKAVIDAILPGKWDELFEMAGGNLAGMVDLVIFLVTEVTRAAGQARLQEVMPETPTDAEDI